MLKVDVNEDPNKKGLKIQFIPTTFGQLSFTEQNDTNKYLLRKCASRYLPLNASKEKKLGFPLPMNDWMKDDKIKEILLDDKTTKRNIFKKEQIEKLFNFEKTSNDPYDFSGKKVWMLVNLEIWMRSFID